MLAKKDKKPLSKLIIAAFLPQIYKLPVIRILSSKKLTFALNKTFLKQLI